MFTPRASAPACERQAGAGVWRCAVLDDCCDSRAASPASQILWPLRTRGRLAKLYAMLLSPYEYTVFLDADVFPCTTASELLLLLLGGGPGHMFSLYDVMMAVNHKGGMTVEPMKCAHVASPQAFAMANSGVIFFRARAPGVRHFLARWLELYALEAEELYDQCTMRTALLHAALAGNVSFYALPPFWNFRKWRDRLQIRQGHGCCPTKVEKRPRALGVDDAPETSVRARVLLDHHCRPPQGARLPTGEAWHDRLLQKHEVNYKRRQGIRNMTKAARKEAVLAQKAANQARRAAKQAALDAAAAARRAERAAPSIVDAVRKGVWGLMHQLAWGATSWSLFGSATTPTATSSSVFGTSHNHALSSSSSSSSSDSRSNFDAETFGTGTLGSGADAITTGTALSSPSSAADVTAASDDVVSSDGQQQPVPEHLLQAAALLEVAQHRDQF